LRAFYGKRGRLPMDEQKLKKYYRAYILSAVLFTVTLSFSLVTQRYCSEMRGTIDKLRTLSGGSVKVKKATQSAYDSMARIKKEIPPAYLSSPVENVIFQAIDTIRERAKNTEVVVESLQDKGDEIDIPVTLKGSLNDYVDFLRMLHFAESLRFPFFSTTELLLTQEVDKPSGYELRGLIRTFKTTETPGKQSESAPRRRS
jgi:hypothetical protein